ncbi:hypothetical protein QX776_07495 [Alteromonadaceae bacterium BrNp21-10]|nr:hypothetical protein [Alteromonadaceae bacterium BrNp21-10]
MSFDHNPDVLQPVHSAPTHDVSVEINNLKLQRQKWTLLSAIFLLSLTLSLLWVWLRPPVYQSQAIIHFTYPQQMGRELAAVPVEQITLNQQRLTSNRVLQTLSQSLAEEKYIQLSTEQLAAMLTAQAHTASRIINLKAHSSEIGVLEPVMSLWLQNYLQQITTEVSDNSLEEQQAIQDKLLALEEKIDIQKLELATFSEANNIVSLERDENRSLSKIKNLNRSLDEAEQELVSLESINDSLQKAMEKGKGVINPSDKGVIDGIRKNIRQLSGQLDGFAERFTEEYMAKDPKTVSIMRALEESKQNLQQRISSSQQNYLQQTQRQLQQALDKIQRISAQLQVLTPQANEFNRKLDEYRRIKNALNELEQQAQRLNNQLIQEQVQKPLEAKINILEPPFVPQFPISPNYWLDSLYSLIGSASLALMGLLVFSFIVRQKQASSSMTSYHVMPVVNPVDNNALLAHQGQANPMLGAAQQPTLQLGQADVIGTAHLRLLSAAECQSLIQAANNPGKIALSLLLHGVSPQELGELSIDDINAEQSLLEIAGAYSRQIVLLPELLALIQQTYSNNDAPFSVDSSIDDLSQRIINAGHDAQMAYPEQLSVEVLRHTYLTFAVSSGIKLSDIEQLAGGISPSALKGYRHVHQRDKITLPEGGLAYDLDWQQALA